MDVLAHVLGNEPSGRLYEALVKTGTAASVSTFAFQLHDPGVLLAMAELREGQSVEEARSILEATLDGLATESPTEVEINRAKAVLDKQFQQMMNDAQSVALNLSEWAAIGDWRLVFLHRDRVAELTTGDVSRVAKAYLKPSNRTVGVFLPTEEPDRAAVPERPEIGPVVESYTGREEVAEGEAFEPTPANVDARTVGRTLPGGMVVQFLPRETRGDRVVASLTLRLGTEGTLTGRATAGELTAGMLMRGTTERTREELEDELDRLQATVDVAGGATQASARIETTRQNLAEVLRLVGEVFRKPAFDTAEFRQLKEEGLSYGVGSNLGAHPIDRSGTFLVYAIYNPENVEEVSAAVREELRQALEEGFTAEEVEAAREGWLRSQTTQRSNDPYLASVLSGNAYLDRDMSYAADLEARVSALSRDEVNAALRRFLDLARISVVKGGDFAGAGEGSGGGER